MKTKTIFKKILDREIPAELIYQDELCVAFHDVQPQAPVHILVIPRQEIPSLAEVGDEQAQLLGHLLIVCSKIAAQQGLGNGFRTVINTGSDGGQTVNHLHFHVLGQRQLAWPPG